jgi:hypothetical protein
MLLIQIKKDGFVKNSDANLSLVVRSTAMPNECIC